MLFPQGTCRHSGKVLIPPGLSRLSSNASDSTACIYSRAGCSSLVPGQGQGQGNVNAGTAAGCGHCQFQPQSWLGSVLTTSPRTHTRPQFPDREPGFSGSLVVCPSSAYWSLIPSPPRLPTSCSRKEHGHPRRGPQQDPPSQRPGLPPAKRRKGSSSPARREECQDIREAIRARIPINFRDCGRGVTYWYSEACDHKEWREELVQLVSVLSSSLESEGRVYGLSVAVASLLLADTEFLLRDRHSG